MEPNPIIARLLAGISQRGTDNAAPPARQGGFQPAPSGAHPFMRAMFPQPPAQQPQAPQFQRGFQPAPSSAHPFLQAMFPRPAAPPAQMAAPMPMQPQQPNIGFRPNPSPAPVGQFGPLAANFNRR